MNPLFRPMIPGVALSLLAIAACASSEKRTVSETDRARLFVQMANSALLEGDPTGALIALKEAEKLNPELPELHHSKALAYHTKKDFASALPAARRAVEIKGDYPDARNTLGKVLLDMGRYDEAIPHLEAAANDPLYREAYKPQTNLGILFYRKGQFARAEKSLDKAIEQAPEASCIAFYYKGHLRMREQKPKDAIRDYAKSIRRGCATFADGHMGLATAYEKSGQYHLARKKLIEIEQAFPNTAVAEQAIERMQKLP